MVVVDINPDYEECDEQETGGKNKKQEAGKSNQRTDHDTNDSSEYDNWRWQEDG